MDIDFSVSGSTQYLPDFADEAVRRLLGPSALTLVHRILDAWQVGGEDAKRLLALAPAMNLSEVDPEQLSQEQMMRASFLIGIYKALHTVHGDTLADEWVRLPNTNAMFGGQAPLAYMVNGDVQALQNVRRLLDGRVGQGGR